MRDIKVRVYKLDHLCLYTGVKDKNGKEICEGDILAYEGDRKGVVTWVASLFKLGFGVIDEDGLDLNDYRWFDLNDFRWDKFDIIGNIYENDEKETDVTIND